MQRILRASPGGPLGLLTAILLAALVTPTRADDAAPRTHALLVGVTKYPSLDEKRWLTGPANDCKVLRDLLVDTFKVAPDDITMLVGWDDANPATRPTRENIQRAFARLAEVAKAGDFVVIQMSGHGAQQPMPPDRDPTNPQSFEPDGLDETFLPADAANWRPDKSSVDNAIIDDELGAWVRAIQQTGAFVWLIVDSCHSGTMTRGALETTRRLGRAELGIPEDVWNASVQRARQAAGQSRGAGAETPPAGALAEVTARSDNLIALYAAQPFEETVELPLPDGATDAPENRFGLLTYQIVDVLKQARRPLSYRELTDLVLARYRAKRSWQGGPTPFAEGAVDRQVLGREVWPARTPIRLREVSGSFEVDAGALQGISAGSVLAVYPPPEGTESDHQALGHVRVISATASRAAVEPCEYAGLPKTASLPAKSVCEVVFYDYGDVRLKIAVLGAGAGTRDTTQTVIEELGKPGTAEFVQLTDTPVDAELVVRIGDDGSADFLVKPPTHDLGSDQVRKYKPCDARDPAALAREVRTRTQRIYKWRNLLRLAGGAGAAGSGDQDASLRVALLQHSSKDDKEGTTLSADGKIAVGQLLSVRLENAGKDDLDVTVLYLDEDFGVKALFPDQPGGNLITAGGKARLGPYPITSASAVSEHVVVIAVPTKRLDRRQDFSFLAQPALERARGEGAADSLLARMLTDAAFGTSRGSLGAAVSPTDTAIILSRSWQATARP